MDDSKALTREHRLALIRAGHRRWLYRVTEERMAAHLSGADHYDEVDVLHRETVSYSARGMEVLA